MVYIHILYLWERYPFYRCPFSTENTDEGGHLSIRFLVLLCIHWRNLHIIFKLKYNKMTKLLRSFWNIFLAIGRRNAAISSTAGGVAVAHTDLTSGRTRSCLPTPRSMCWNWLHSSCLTYIWNVALSEGSDEKYRVNHWREAILSRVTTLSRCVCAGVALAEITYFPPMIHNVHTILNFDLIFHESFDKVLSAARLVRSGAIKFRRFSEDICKLFLFTKMQQKKSILW